MTDEWTWLQWILAIIGVITVSEIVHYGLQAIFIMLGLVENK